MQIENRAKNPTDFAHGLEKQELRWPTTGQEGTLLGEGHLQPGSPPPPETAPAPPTEARGGGRADGAVTTPPPGSQPRGLPRKPPNRRAAEQSAAGGERAGLGACGVTLAFRPQFPQAPSEARPARPPPPPPGLRAQDSRPTVTGRLRPFPPPRAAPRPPRPRAAPAPSAPTRTTCDLGDERFRHQRHGGCGALDARLRPAALGARPLARPRWRPCS